MFEKISMIFTDKGPAPLIRSDANQGDQSADAFAKVLQSLELPPSEAVAEASGLAKTESVEGDPTEDVAPADGDAIATETADTDDDWPDGRRLPASVDREAQKIVTEQDVKPLSTGSRDPVSKDPDSTVARAEKAAETGWQRMPIAMPVKSQNTERVATNVDLAKPKTVSDRQEGRIFPTVRGVIAPEQTRASKDTGVRSSISIPDSDADQKVQIPVAKPAMLHDAEKTKAVFDDPALKDPGLKDPGLIDARVRSTDPVTAAPQKIEAGARNKVSSAERALENISTPPRRTHESTAMPGTNMLIKGPQQTGVASAASMPQSGAADVRNLDPSAPRNIPKNPVDLIVSKQPPLPNPVSSPSDQTPPNARVPMSDAVVEKASFADLRTPGTPSLAASREPGTGTTVPNQPASDLPKTADIVRLGVHSNSAFSTEPNNGVSGSNAQEPAFMRNRQTAIDWQSTPKPDRLAEGPSALMQPRPERSSDMVSPLMRTVHDLASDVREGLRPVIPVDGRDLVDVDRLAFFESVRSGGPVMGPKTGTLAPPVGWPGHQTAEANTALPAIFSQSFIGPKAVRPGSLFKHSDQLVPDAKTAFNLPKPDTAKVTHADIQPPLAPKTPVVAAQNAATNTPANVVTKPQALAIDSIEGEQVGSFATLTDTRVTPGQTVAAAPGAQAQHTATSVVRQMMEVLAQTQDGTVELRLSPEELGRVRMQITSSEQGVMMHITAERPETLDMLRRNIDQLQRDLNAMGYSNPRFSFEQQGDRGSGQGGHGRADTPAIDLDPATNPPLQPTVAPTEGLDIRV